VGDGLREEAALGTHQDDRTALVDCLDRREDWLRLHHHARAPAVGIVVHDMVLIGRDRADIMQRDTQQALLLSAFEDALRERSLEHFGKERKNVNVHEKNLALRLNFPTIIAAITPAVPV
jgi:hypothetical protein